MRTVQARSDTKEKLLEAAIRLMLAKGFVATTVDEICEAARLTKGSFFHYFETKEELGKAALEHFCESKMREFQEAPFLKENDPLKRVYGRVDFTIHMAKKMKNDPIARGGCLVGTFAQELSSTHPEIRTLCADKFAQSTEWLKKDLEAAKVKYAPNSRLDTQSLAEHFLAIVEGSLILAKAQQNPAVMVKNLQHFKQYVKTFFGR